MSKICSRSGRGGRTTSKLCSRDVPGGPSGPRERLENVFWTFSDPRDPIGNIFLTFYFSRFSAVLSKSFLQCQEQRQLDSLCLLVRRGSQSRFERRLQVLPPGQFRRAAIVAYVAFALRQPIASTKPKQRQGNPSTLHRAPARLALQANRFPRPAVYIYTRRGQDGSVGKQCASHS